VQARLFVLLERVGHLGLERLAQAAEEPAHGEFAKLEIAVAVEPACRKREGASGKGVSGGWDGDASVRKGGDAPLVHDGGLERAQTVLLVELGRHLDAVRLADEDRVEDAAGARRRVDAERAADDGREDRVELLERGVVRLGGARDRGDVESSKFPASE